MKLEIYHIGGASFLLRVNGGLVIGCDPFLDPAGTLYDFRFFRSERIRGPSYDAGLLAGAELWLLTHGHADHVDARGISAIGKDARIVTGRGAGRFLRGRDPALITRLEWNDTCEFVFGRCRVHVRAVPAYHGSNFISRILAGKANGYLLDISEGDSVKRVYVTSDTVFHPDIIRSVGCDHIDCMIANTGEVMKGKFGGPLTMSVAMLSRFRDELRPGRIVPVHIDDFSHYHTTKDDLLSEGYLPVEQGRWTCIS